MPYRVKDTMISENEIKQRVKELAMEIEGDFNNEAIMLIVVLKGSFVFAADLIRGTATSVIGKSAPEILRLRNPKK